MPKCSAAVVMVLISIAIAACKPKTPPSNVDATSTVTSSPVPKAGGAVPTDGKAPVASEQFDVEKIPVSQGTLPPFPYLEYPPSVNQEGRFTEKMNFDSLYVVTGKQLRKVEGRVEAHKFYLSDANLSNAEARRNYENLINQMGGVKVNDATPSELAPASGNEPTLNDQKTHSDWSMTYDAYLVRKPDQLVWIVLMSSNSNIATLVIAERPFKQTIAFITADAMQSQLASAGHVALYINFDTDKASIRPDGKPAVDEITKLLEKDSSLKLTIEGHTDNVGDPAHNQALSQQRAEAVMGSLIAAGVAKERLSAVGLGSSKPVADNKDEAGRAKNRRVELVKRS